jgi:hypothetical protein
MALELEAILGLDFILGGHDKGAVLYGFLMYYVIAKIRMTDNENIFHYCSSKPININTLWKTG